MTGVLNQGSYPLGEGKMGRKLDWTGINIHAWREYTLITAVFTIQIVSVHWHTILITLKWLHFKRGAFILKKKIKNIYLHIQNPKYKCTNILKVKHIIS